MLYRRVCSLKNMADATVNAESVLPAESNSHHTSHYADPATAATTSTSVNSEPKQHHIQLDFCTTRPPYRSGRELKAVKVYTVSQESRYLLVLNIPAVGATQELIKLFALYGAIEEYRLLDDYPSPEQYTEVMWVKYTQIRSARYGKKKMDNYNFYGGTLHVCYAPEYESVEDTRQKLNDRKREVVRRIRILANPDQEKHFTNRNKQSHKSNSSAGAVNVAERLNPESEALRSLPVQGPSLPEETERKRKSFQSSETGDQSYDKTVSSVRNTVSMFSTPFIPRAVKKKKTS